MRIKLLSILTILFFLFVQCKKEETDVPETIIQTDTTTTTEPVKIYIYGVTASPTDNESITLKNNSGASIDISGWTLGDENNSTAYSIPSNTILAQGELKTIIHTTLGFQINDSGETIYLKNLSGVSIDTWGN